MLIFWEWRKGFKDRNGHIGGGIKCDTVAEAFTFLSKYSVKKTDVNLYKANEDFSEYVLIHPTARITKKTEEVPNEV